MGGRNSRPRVRAALVSETKTAGIFVLLVAPTLPPLRFLIPGLRQSPLSIHDVMLIGTALFLCALGVFLWKIDLWERAVEMRAAETRVPWFDAKIVVHGAKRTRLYVGHDPELELEFTLRIDGHPDRTLATRRVVNALEAPHLLPGSEYKTKVNPDDLDIFHVEAWE